jgi:hypothetical protein
MAVVGVMSAEVTHHGAFDLQVCVPDDWTDEQARDFAERKYPCGTSAGWQIRREGDPMLGGAPERVKCEGRAGHVHIMLDA